MILSVSRRTDIPSYYSKWLINRFREGYLYVRNPVNPIQVSKVVLDPQIIDCIVFWTKDPGPIIPYLDELSQYPYYFHVTVNPYDTRIEKNVPDKTKVIKNIEKLSKLIDKQRVIWRYNPVILSERYSLEYHKKYFEALLERLAPYVSKCVVSFLEVYSKVEKNMVGIEYYLPTKEEKIELMKHFVVIGKGYGIQIEVCSETIDFTPYGAKKTKCIDDRLISNLLDSDIIVDKDKGQRDVCGCVKSIDVGDYNTCHHDCIYCYANVSQQSMEMKRGRHNPDSPFLIGELEAEDIVTIRAMKKYRSNYKQVELEFD